MKNITIALLSLIGSLWAAYPPAALPPGFKFGAFPTYINHTNIQVGTTNKIYWLRDRNNSWDIVGTNAVQLYTGRSYTAGVDVGALTTNSAIGIAYLYSVDRERSNKGVAPAFMLSVNPTNAPTFTNNGSTNPPTRLYTTSAHVASLPIFSADGTGGISVAPFLVSRAGNISRTEFFLSNRYTGGIIPNVGTNTSFTVVDLTNYLPQGATHVLLNISLSGYNATNASASFRSIGGSAGANPQIFVTASNVGSISHKTTLRLPVFERTFSYLVALTNHTLEAAIYGWEEELQ